MFLIICQSRKLINLSFPTTLAELAKVCHGQVVGDADCCVTGICSVEKQKPQHLTFIGVDKLLKLVVQDSESLYIVTSSNQHRIRNGIAHDNPTQAFRLILNAVFSQTSDCSEIAATAKIADNVHLGENVSIGHHSMIASGAVIGDNCVIADNCFVADNVKLGNNTRLLSRVSIHSDCEIGEDCVIADGAVIGGQGFGFSFEAGQWEAIPQIGRVIIGQRVHIGSNSCIDRGAINDTIIGNNVIIDNLVHIAHNVVVGDGCAMAAGVGIAGSTTIGKYCLLGGQVGVVGHISICDGVQVNGGARILQSITTPGAYAGSLHVMPVNKWNRAAIYFKRIEQLFRKRKKHE